MYDPKVQIEKFFEKKGSKMTKIWKKMREFQKFGGKTADKIFREKWFETLNIFYIAFKVVRHVGRQRIPKDSEFLQQDSPKGTLVFNKPDPTRESIMPDATTEFMDMSIRQVVELKKMTSNYSK